MRVKIRFTPLLVALILTGFLPKTLAKDFTLPLAGAWRFELDRHDLGIEDAYFKRDLAQTIQLPGILQAQGFGDEISTNTPWVLSLYDKLWFQREDYKAFTTLGQVKVPFVSQPERHYLGVAWYQRDIEIPKEWEGRRVVLFLERTRWETRAWLDDKLVGTNRSLCTPHEFDFGILTPGKHRLTVRVDNRMLLNYRPDAHAVSDSLGSTWNGIVGKIELRSTPPVWIDQIQVKPINDKSVLELNVRIGNATGRAVKAAYNANVLPDKNAEVVFADKLIDDGVAEVPPGGSWIQFKTSIYPRTPVWDEFEPNLQQVYVSLSAQSYKDSRWIKFGLRDFKTSGQEFIVNGRPTHLRGTHHGGDFPLTGYPPCDVEYWRKLFQACKEWGLNHMRFHSFCPPEAAFTAADELGIYLHIEPGMWNTFNPDSPMEEMLYEETKAIIRSYGNHPSFVLLSASNEPKGRWTDVLPKWAAHFRAADPRRLYTTATGFTDANAPGPLDQADFTVTGRFRTQRIRGEPGWFGRDYSRALTNVNIPAVTHELGQWIAYPDFGVIKKFTGFIRPGNYEIFHASAAANGVLEYNKEFAHASGRYQLACYKEEIEANLRTPGLAGFQLLDLHDYTGQGTALVGLLDPFWEEKGYVDAVEWRRFCSPTVPLAKLSQRVFTTSDTLDATFGVAHYGAAPLTNISVKWQVFDHQGKTVLQGDLPVQNSVLGRNLNLGKTAIQLSKLPAPANYCFAFKVGEARNCWNFWLYPAQVPAELSKDVLVTSSWAEAEAKLSTGGKVVFLPHIADLGWSSPPLDNVPVFWNRLMNPQWGRMLGLWCDANHPALAGFPTEANCDWQWTQITRGMRAINISKLPRQLKPIVAAIDDWNRNWKLAPIFEAKVGQGKLLVCSFDLTTKLNDRIVALQLRRSLLDYAASDKFKPAVAVSAEQLRGLWFDTLVMRKLGATVTASSGAGADALDGDPNTAWLAGARSRGNDGLKHPHTLTVAFTNAVAMNGVMLMNRQNDRDHLGDVRGYTIELSNDGQTWRKVAGGELPSTWNPQTLSFPQQETARQLRFTALSGYGADTSAALAELAVLYAGPALPENSEGGVTYRRVRSTSSDVDEGETTTARPQAKP